jgi:DNA-binding MarR family transcriptional regulator
MAQEELLAIAEEIAGLMPRLARGLTSAEKDPADSLPLAQLRLCGILSEGPRPMSALSRELGVSQSALSQIADRLERTGLVKRAAEESDRRIRCLQLTPRGEKMMRKRREARVRRTLAVLEHLAARQRETVRASLEILVDACAAVHAGEPPGGYRATEKASEVSAVARDPEGGHPQGTRCGKPARIGNGHHHEIQPSKRSARPVTNGSTTQP